MGRPFIEYVEDGGLPKYVCAECSSDVASSSCLIWEGYMDAAPSRLATGHYTLVDVQCQCCNHVLGWKYLKAQNYDQKYKEGGTLMQQDALVRVDAADKCSGRAAGSCDS